ncbi:putative mechanosensitive ion channel protein [Encephalitozoon hellem]|nr:putative mechanosensitive ion channel protein [Encephalitozoon hellem]
MEKEDFRWFEGDGETDAEEFTPAPARSSSLNYMIDAIGGIFYSVFVISLVARLVTYVFGLSPHVLTLDINLVLLSTIVISLLFILLSVARETITFMGLTLGIVENSDSYAKLQRLVTVSAWFGASMYWMNYVKMSYGYDFDIARKVFASGMITSMTYSVMTAAMGYFGSFFLEKTLKTKMNDVEETERIVYGMKNYRYDVSESVSSRTPECSCRDIFCFRASASIRNREIRKESGEEGAHLFVGGLVINPPQIHGIIDAKTLARDVFTKASNGKDFLSFSDFSSIFPTPQDASNAFSFFDSNNDRTISKKAFHDTIMHFYMERVNLEKSIARTEDFIGVVTNTLNTVVAVVLCFTYLIIFGISPKELLTLTLSGSLAFSFVASKIIPDMYRNFMMLTIHPFDVGDDVIVDGTDYRVYEFGLTSTSLIGENGGKIKFLNSDLWKKKLINMTRAPEKIITFNFDLNPDIKVEDFGRFKGMIREFIKKRPFDYDGSFSIQAKTESFASINVLSCTMVLKCKNYKNKSKKFVLRVEMTAFLRSLITSMNIGAK